MMIYETAPLKELLGEKGYIRGPFGSALKRGELKDRGVPVYEQQHAIYGMRDFRFFIDDEKYETLKRFTVRTNDLIISCSGTVGRISVIGENDPKGIISQALLILRPEANKILPEFLYYFLTSQNGYRELINASQGAVQQNIAPRNVVEKIPVPLPDMDAQKEVVDILGSIDQKIELNQQMNETLEGVARALFKSWFVDFDPVHAKANGEQPAGMDTETAALFPSTFTDDSIPEGWRETTLEKIADLNPESWGKANHPDYVEYVDLANTKWGTVESTQCYSWEDAPSRARRILKPGDTIVGTVRPGNGSYSFIGMGGLTGSTGFAVLRPQKEIYREAVCYAATSKDNIDRLAHLADGGAYPAVRPDVVISTPFIYPGDEVLEAFSKFTADILDKAEANKQENITLSNLRDTLLPKLISGELRVDVADNQLREAVG